MNKLRLLGIILAVFSPLVATVSNAQLDLFSPVEVGLEGYCLEHPELRNDPSCAKFYRRNPTGLKRPNATTPRSTSSRQVIAEYKCNSPTSSTTMGRGSYIITCGDKKIEWSSSECSSIGKANGIYRCFRE